MAKKKKTTPSRVQQFRAKQRREWLNYFGKVAPFAIAAIIFTTWLVIELPKWGKDLPVWVVQSSEKPESVDVSDYSCQAVYGDLEDGSLEFGGPKKNTVVIYASIVGTARKAETSSETLGGSNAQWKPYVWKKREDECAQYRGLLEDAPEGKWSPFEDYLKKLLKVVEKGREGHKGKVVIALDVEHPDLPGQLPPQANEFMQLVKNDVQRDDEGLLERLESKCGHSVCLWLSHSPGQRSYYHSDPENVGSFFKHAFEISILGGTSNAENGDIEYEQLKTALKSKVSGVASNHGLLQTPLFLEPKGFSGDFLIQPKGSQTLGNLGKLFAYGEREWSDTPAIFWGKLTEAKRKFSWETENPLRIQQITTLLLQMDRLWYVGKSKTRLYVWLGERVQKLLDHHVVQPVQHSLYDAKEYSSRIGDSAFSDENLQRLAEPAESLITPQTAKPADDSPPVDGPDKTEVVDDKKPLGQWSKSLGDDPFPATLSLWQVVVADTEPSREKFNKVLRLLENPKEGKEGSQLYCSAAYTTNGTSEQSEVVWNEVAYLHRLGTELVWPTKSDDERAFTDAVHLSLELRDLSNQFGAELSPLMLTEFDKDFTDIENDRRLAEDRLFANDTDGLIGTFEKLVEQMTNLRHNYRRTRMEFESLQERLLFQPHLVRHLLERSAYSTNTQVQEYLNGSHWVEAKNKTIKTLREGSSKQQNSTSFDLIRELVPSGEIEEAHTAAGNLACRERLRLPCDCNDRTKHLELYKALSKAGSKVDGSNNDAPPATRADGKLTELASKFDWLVPLKTFSAPVAEPDDLLRLAENAHRLLPLASESSSKPIESKLDATIQSLQAQKSDFDFQRVASDLWATPKTGGRDTFVVKSLERHRRLVKQRLDKMHHKNYGGWDDLFKPDEKWAKEVDKKKVFSDEFKHWKRNEYWLENSGLIREPAEMLANATFRLSPHRSTFSKVKSIRLSDRGPFKLKPEQSHGDISVYLRGHESRRLESIEGPKSNRVVISSKPSEHENSESRISIFRGTDGILGHVKLVIDCSKSMKEDGRFKNLQAGVKTFLARLSTRQGYKITLFAIGANRNYTKKDGEWTIIRSKPLKYWTLASGREDVWVSKVGELSNGKNLKESLAAINELQAYGETPILAGLDLAVSKENSAVPELTVLLTDGFEYALKSNFSGHKEFDHGKYNRLKRALRSDSKHLLVYNMLGADLYSQVAVENAFHLFFKGLKTEKKKEYFELVRDRIHRVDNLATKTASGGLDSFFDELLPLPSASLTGAAEEDEQNFGKREVGLSSRPTKRNASWGIEVVTGESLVPAFFPVGRISWNASTHLVGNEKLEFDFKPYGLQLRGGLDEREGDQIIKFGTGSLKQDILVRKDLDADKRKPQVKFRVSAKGRSEITPAPAMAILRLKGAKNKSILLQDFRLNRQERSNVHPIVFPEIQKSVVNSLIGENEDAELFLIDRFYPPVWDFLKLDWASGGQPRITNESGSSIKPLPSRFESADEHLNSKLKVPYEKFTFSVQYKENAGIDSDSNEQALLKVKVTRNPDFPNEPLDSWLVQLVQKEPYGIEVHRNCRLESKRNYISSGGAGGFDAIEHEFVMNRSVLEKLKGEKQGVHIAIGYLDEVIDGSPTTPKSLKYPKLLD